MDAPAGDDQAALEKWKKDQQIIKMRVIHALKSWCEKLFVADFADRTDLSDMVVTFVQENILNTPEDKWGRTVLAVIQEKMAEAAKAANATALRQEATALRTALSDFGVGALASYNMMDLAKELALVLHELYSEVLPTDLLIAMVPAHGETTAPGPSTVPRLEGFQSALSKLTRWVVHHVVSSVTAKDQVDMLSLMVDLADASRTVNNFAAMFSILEGFEHPALARLPKLFVGLGRASVSKLTALREFASPSNDYAAYRSLLKSLGQPHIPHLQIVLKDITAMEASAPTVLTNGLINFNKHRSIAQLVTTYLHPAVNKYTYLSSLHTRRYLLAMNPPGDAELMTFSMTLDS
jgi:EAL domain-containing protein (putative c-di-GMP-specific phosphodiesterase class I)